MIGKALTGELSCLVTDLIASLLSVVQLVKQSTGKVFSFRWKGSVIQRSKKEVRKSVHLHNMVEKYGDVPYLFGYKTGVSPLQNDYK